MKNREIARVNELLRMAVVVDDLIVKRGSINMREIRVYIKKKFL